MRHVSCAPWHYRSLFMSLMAFAASLALALDLWRGGLITARGVMQIGTLSVFMTYAQGMMDPIQWIVQVFSNLINVQVNVERFTRLMETQSDVQDTPEVIEKYGDAFEPKRENWEELGGDVEFEDVTFRYPDGDECVSSIFNLKIPHGTNVANVGGDRRGKVHACEPRLRFFEPTEGRILIDGRHVRERSQLWLHSHIGYVPADAASVLRHQFSKILLYGKPDASMEQVRAAVKAVSADYINDRSPTGKTARSARASFRPSPPVKSSCSLRPGHSGNPRISGWTSHFPRRNRHRAY
jgi:ATP-binding cassette subfamily B protein